jgi:flagellar protein FlaJ
MAELYTILLIVFPLLAIIMLSIMAIMSPSLAGFDLMTLMNLMTYVMVPFFGFILLFMMDSMVPKR